MASFIIATVVFMTIMGATLYFRVDGKVTGLTEDMALRISRASSVGLSEWVDNMVNLTGAFAELDFVRSPDWTRAGAFLEVQLKKHQRLFEMFFISDPEGRVQGTGGTTADISARAYFKTLMQGEAKMVISNPVVSLVTGKVVFVIAHAIPGVDGKPAGVFAATVLLQNLQRLVDGVRVGETGYGWIVDGTGVVVAHRDREHIGKFDVRQDAAYATVWKRMSAGETGFELYSRFDGTPAYVFFTPIERSPGWSFAVTVLESEIKATAVDLSWTIVIIVAFVVVAFMIISLLIGNSITRPVRTVQSLAERAKSGDLTILRSDFNIKTKDELGRMADALADMIQVQRHMVRDLKEKAVGLSALSEETAASTEEVTSAVSEVAETNASLAEKTRSGRQDTVDASMVMLEMSSLIQIAQNLATKADKNSEEMASAALQGEATVEKTINQMERVKESVSETEAFLSQLDTFSQRIGVVGETITGIAEQTNLLALNAAIEAARAGEAGRGFAVVAEEVRKLAEQSQKGAREVAELVAKILEGTRSAVSSMQKSQEGVTEGVAVAHSAGDALRKIKTAIEGSIEDIRKIIKTTDEEVAKSDKVIALINASATVMESTDDNVQSLAAAMEETAAAMENVATGAQEVSETAEELRRMSERFKVDDGSEENGGGLVPVK